MKIGDIGSILGLNDLTYLGEGEFGVAYLSDNEKVLKITNDKNEFCVMTRLFLYQQEKIKNGVSESEVYENSIKIDGVWLLPNGEMIILMDYVETDGVEDKFNAIFDSEEIGFMEYFDMDEEDLAEQGIIDKDGVNFVFSVSSSLFDFRRAGISTDDFDVSPSNIGLNKYGNYVLFDQRQKTRIAQSVENEFNDLFEKGLIKDISSIKVSYEEKSNVKISP